MNLLAFVAGSPVNSLDPFGLEQCGAEDEEERPNWLEIIIKFIISHSKHVPTPISFLFDPPAAGGATIVTKCNLIRVLNIVGQDGNQTLRACCYDCEEVESGKGGLGVPYQKKRRFGLVWFVEPTEACESEFHGWLEG